MLDPEHTDTILGWVQAFEDVKDRARVVSMKEIADEDSTLTYRRGASGIPVPVLRGTGLRVQTVVTAHETWGMTPDAIADEYGLTRRQIEEALAFASAHRAEIEADMAHEAELAKAGDG